MLEVTSSYFFEVSTPFTVFYPPVIEHLTFVRNQAYSVTNTCSKSSCVVKDITRLANIQEKNTFSVRRSSSVFNFRVLTPFEYKLGFSSRARISTLLGQGKLKGQVSTICKVVHTKYFERIYSFCFVKESHALYNASQASYAFTVKDLYLSKLGTDQCRIEVKDNGEIPKLIIDLPLGYYGPLLEFTQPIKKIIKQPFFVQYENNKLRVYTAFKSIYTFTVILANDQAIEITVRPVTIEFLSDKLIG